MSPINYLFDSTQNKHATKIEASNQLQLTTSSLRALGFETLALIIGSILPTMSFNKRRDINLSKSITPSCRRHRHRIHHSCRLLSIKGATAVSSLMIILFSVFAYAAVASSRHVRVLQQKGEKIKTNMKTLIMNNYWRRSHRVKIPPSSRQFSHPFIKRKCYYYKILCQSYLMCNDNHKANHRLIHTSPSSSSSYYFSSSKAPLLYFATTPTSYYSLLWKKSLSYQEKATKILPVQLTRLRCLTQFSRKSMQEFTAKEKDNRALPLDSSDEKVVYENPNNVSEGNDTIKAHHDQHLEASKWFEQLLPEGYCVGIRIALQTDQISKCESHFDQKNEDCVIINDSEQIMTTANLLHSEEWTWGQTKIGSDASRTSYYLGRMALRSAMRSLLLLSSFEDDEAHHANKLLWEQIQSTPILKDGHGRPVLPEMIAGSISHKGDCAVAVARFRNEEAAFVGLLSRDDDSVRISNSDDKDCVHARHSDTKSSVVAWKEECPISTKENFDQETLLSKQNRTGYSTIEQTLGGIGIDLERIDGTRGRRIQSKVLTKREQKELGGLEVGSDNTMRVEGIFVDLKFSTIVSIGHLIVSSNAYELNVSGNWNIQRGGSDAEV